MSEMNEMDRMLDSFFEGLESGLASLREVRATYDEQIAFDFNPLGVLKIDENAVTRLLLYLIDPEGKHGQKNTLLKIFLKQIGAAEAVGKVDEGLRVKIDYQYYTDNRRPIDAVIRIGDDGYIIGIENKVWDAADQFGQVSDYIKDIRGKSKGDNNDNWLMLYLSSWGQDPSSDSIIKEELDTYKKDGRFRNVPFVSKKAGDISLLTILESMAVAAKADSVRAFINLVIKYFESHFLGGITMDEQDYIDKYVKKKPEVIRYSDAIARSKQKLANDYFRAVFEYFKDELCFKKEEGIVPGTSFEGYLPEEMMWDAEPFPVVVQLDRTDKGIIRIGILSGNKEKFNSLYEAFCSKFGYQYSYQENSAWGGGFFEAHRGFYTDEAIIEYCKGEKSSLQGISDVFDQVNNFLKNLKNIEGVVTGDN